MANFVRRKDYISTSHVKKINSDKLQQVTNLSFNEFTNQDIKIKEKFTTDDRQIQVVTNIGQSLLNKTFNIRKYRLTASQLLGIKLEPD